MGGVNLLGIAGRQHLGQRFGLAKFLKESVWDSPLLDVNSVASDFKDVNFLRQNTILSDMLCSRR